MAAPALVRPAGNPWQSKNRSPLTMRNSVCTVLLALAAVAAPLSSLAQVPVQAPPLNGGAPDTRFSGGTPNVGLAGGRPNIGLSGGQGSVALSGGSGSIGLSGGNGLINAALLPGPL